MRFRQLSRSYATLLTLSALAALGLMAASCGDDDDDDDSTPSTPTSAAVTAAGASPTAAGASPTTAATQAAADAVTIGVADNKYEPASRTVQRGAKVTWNWTGSNPHTVEGTFAGQSVKSDVQTSGKFEFTFAQAGTFSYQCGVHGASMSGTVTVQ